MTDRFDLENQIMRAWNITDDIGDVLEQYMDGHEKMTEDEMANTLMGLKELSDIRFRKLWKIFEDLVHNGQI